MNPSRPSSIIIIIFGFPSPYRTRLETADHPWKNINVKEGTDKEFENHQSEFHGGEERNRKTSRFLKN
jgi:hypothetical protein